MDDSSTSGTDDDTDLEFDDLDAERLCLDPVIFYKHCAVEVIVQDDAGYCQVSAGRLVRAKGAWRISRAHTAGRWQRKDRAAARTAGGHEAPDLV